MSRPSAKPGVPGEPASAARGRVRDVVAVRRGEPPIRRSIQEYLVHKLGAEIVGGVYPEGTLLPNEAEICARFEVSRNTLREAFSVLASKSLIVARQRIGTRVRPKSEWNILDPDVLAWSIESVPSEAFVAELYVLRQLIEPEAAALAASTPTPEVVARVEAAYAGMELAKDRDGDLVGADLDFHIAILEAAGNRFIVALSGLINAALTATFRLSWEGAAYLRDDRLHQHRDVFLAIKAGKPELARRRMKTLLSDSFGDVQGFLRRH